MTVLNFAKVRPDAIIPTKREEDSGRDVYCNFKEDYLTIHPQETVLIPTGIASAFSDDYYLQIQERGSTAVSGMCIGAGVIDSGFRGEIKVVVTNHSSDVIIIAKEEFALAEMYGEVAPNNCVFYDYNKAIAQLILLPVPKVEVREIPYEDLVEIESVRGTGMVGSSGK